MNNVEPLYRRRVPATDRVTEKAPPRHLLDKPRRRGGRLLALGVLLVLAGALAFGAWRYYSQHREAVAISQQRREFVPSVRVASVRASGSTVLVYLPATTSAFSAADIFARSS